MNLLLKSSGGVKYLRLVQCCRVPNKSYPVHKTIKNFGRYDNLPKSLHAIMESSDKSAKKALERRLEQVAPEEMDQVLLNLVSDLDALMQADAEATKPKNPYFNKAETLRYGHLVFKSIWDKDLNLRRKIEHIQDTYSQVKTWRFNDAVFYLVMRKLIDPASYRSAHNRKGNYFYCPWQDINQDNFYRVLDVVYEHGQSLIAHAGRSHLERTDGKVKVAFFDCTNTWFETPYDDATWELFRAKAEIRTELLDQGKTESEVQDYLDGIEFQEQFKERIEAKSDQILRMRGPSKEGRYSQPLVLVALVIDQTGFPIDCAVFAGNQSELKTIEPMLTSLRAKYSIDDVYFTADRGLNSTQNLHEIVKRGHGFVVAQKVSRQTQDNRDEMTNPEGYFELIEEGGKIRTTKIPARDMDNCARYKICNFEKTCSVPRADGSTTPSGRPRKEKVTVPCQIIYTFSPKRKARDLAELAQEKARALLAIAEGQIMGNYGSGWRALVQTDADLAGTKKDKEHHKARQLNKQVLKEREAIAGYYSIVFEHPEGVDPKDLMSEEEILNTYHQLVGIEDCFRLMKSNFSLRPMYVRKPERIKAHSYLCVMALMLLKELLFKLEANNADMTIPQVLDALCEAKVAVDGTANYQGIKFLNLTINQGHYAPKFSNKDFKEQKLDKSDIQALNSWISERMAKPDDIDVILTAAGLQPLKKWNSLVELKKALGIPKTSNERVLPPSSLISLSLSNS